MTRQFDLVVLGTGSAASAAAFPCREAGWSVAVVDYRPFGGTCPLRGCDPKKVLVGAAELLDWTLRMRGKGVAATEARIDWPELMRFKRSFTSPFPARKEQSFLDAGIAAYHGPARFLSPGSVQVNDDTLAAKHFLIATGAHPARLNIPGEHLLTISDQFLELDRLPASIVFVGGGYIAFEFAHIAARAGARVTILHRGTRPLEQFDPDLVGLLAERTRRLGVDLRLGADADAVSGAPAALTVHASTAGSPIRVDAEMVVHAAGRTPDIDDLDLAAASVDHSPKGVTVNEFLQSVSNPAVYAAGDAANAGGAPLTPVAGYHGRIVAANLLEGNRHQPDYTGLASAVFTIPPLASVGLTEDAARRRKLGFVTRHENTSTWYSSRRVAEEFSAYKVLLDPDDGRILGAHILGDSAAEMISVFALAIHARLRAADVKSVLYAYPTHGSDIQYMLG